MVNFCLSKHRNIHYFLIIISVKPLADWVGALRQERVLYGALMMPVLIYYLKTNKKPLRVFIETLSF